MQLFELIDSALIRVESRSSNYSRTPRVWPSEASATLMDQREADIVGGCHRKSFFRLIGEPQSDPVDVVGARRFRTGRAIELDMIELAKEAGIFVACGVRHHVAEIDMPLELDLVVMDPDTHRLYIVENKTIYGYYSGKKVIREGNPKLEGVMQASIYLREFGTGAKLKAAIRQGVEARDKALARIREMQEIGALTEAQRHELRGVIREYQRNRIEVHESNLSYASDGPVGVKLAYETRDDCRTREFDVSAYPREDGLHYPAVDGTPWTVFVIENIYERFRVLQEYHRRAVEWGRQQMEAADRPEPDPANRMANKEWWDDLFAVIRANAEQLWPPAEYEWRYTREKIVQLGDAGIIGKTKYQKWQKGHKGYEYLGAWQCAYCGYKARCISHEYPEMAHMLNDLRFDTEDEAA